MNDTVLLIVCVKYPTNSYGHIGTRPQLKVSSNILEKPGIKPVTIGLHLASGVSTTPQPPTILLSTHNMFLVKKLSFNYTLLSSSP